MSEETTPNTEATEAQAPSAEATPQVDAAAGTAVEDEVLFDFVQDFASGEVVADGLEGAVRAGGDALGADGAELAIDDRFLARSPGDGVFGTGIDAATAGATLVGSEHQFGAAELAFGVAAPEAAQRAALHEDERADAGSVVQRMALDVEDRGRN